MTPSSRLRAYRDALERAGMHDHVHPLAAIIADVEAMEGEVAENRRVVVVMPRQIGPTAPWWFPEGVGWEDAP